MFLCCCIYEIQFLYNTDSHCFSISLIRIPWGSSLTEFYWKRFCRFLCNLFNWNFGVIRRTFYYVYEIMFRYSNFCFLMLSEFALLFKKAPLQKRLNDRLTPSGRSMKNDWWTAFNFDNSRRASERYDTITVEFWGCRANSTCHDGFSSFERFCRSNSFGFLSLSCQFGT